MNEVIKIFNKRNYIFFFFCLKSLLNEGAEQTKYSLIENEKLFFAWLQFEILRIENKHV